MFYFHELWYQKTHTPTSTNRDVLDSLHCWQTSQGIIRSWLYIIAECQISLESAAYTKSHLTMLLLLSPHPLLLGFILLSRISDSLSSFTFFLLIFMRAGKFLRIMDLFLTYVLAFFYFLLDSICKEKKMHNVILLHLLLTTYVLHLTLHHRLYFSLGWFVYIMACLN